MKVHYLFILMLCTTTGCDYMSTGEIQNNRNEDIEIVIGPYNNESYSDLTNNAALPLTKWDQTNQKGYFKLKSNTSALVATGINSFTPQELKFNYIEIRTSEDTLVIANQIEIHKRFKETKKHSYTWPIE